MCYWYINSIWVVPKCLLYGCLIDLLSTILAITLLNVLRISSNALSKGMCTTNKRQLIRLLNELQRRLRLNRYRHDHHRHLNLVLRHNLVILLLHLRVNNLINNLMCSILVQWLSDQSLSTAISLTQLIVKLHAHERIGVHTVQCGMCIVWIQIA